MMRNESTGTGELIEPVNAESAPTAGESLEQITAELENFLVHWVNRVKLAVGQNPDSPDRYQIMRQLTAEFEAQRRQWSETQKQEAMELEEQAKQLSDAWLRLESERRTEMQSTQVVQRRVSSQPSSTPPPAETPLQSSPKMSRNATASPKPISSLSNQSSPSLTRQMAIRQLEQLKREVGNQTNEFRNRTFD